MGKHKNIIVLNGQAYDSTTGVLETFKATPHKQTKSLEGFIRVNATGQTKDKRPVTISIPAHMASHSHSAPELHHKRDRSKTLMRSSVAKPKYNSTKAISGRLEPTSEPFKPELNHNDKISLAAKRQSHAKTISKSAAVSRFYKDSYAKVSNKTASLDVKSLPLAVYEPINTGTQTAVHVASDIFTNAISSATSHKQAAPKKPRVHHKIGRKFGLSRRSTNIGAAVLAVIFLAGFTAYQNWASISLHMADNKAGLSATLPGYKPAGFSFNHTVQASPGQVVINFSSNSDQRNFSVIQSASDWNSQTLLDDFVAASDQPYQKISQPSGKTVFLYGDSNATWVDGGIWYKIVGNSGLNSDQLLKIAGSF